MECDRLNGFKREARKAVSIILCKDCNLKDTCKKIPRFDTPLIINDEKGDPQFIIPL